MAVCIHPRVLCPVSLLLFLFGTVTLFASPAPIQAAQPGSAQAASVSGQTTNAVTGQPVPRVLVRYGLQAMLTDSQGMFHFDADVPGSSLTASKPGYTLGEDAGDAGPVLSPAELAGGLVQIRLYPEAILTGTIQSPEGDPLQGVVVTVSRSQYDESGHRWVQSGTTRADFHGEFRLPLLAGEYRLQTIYTAPTVTRGEAVLPVILPEGSTSNGSAFLRLRAGETQRVELRPAVVPVTAVTVRIEPEEGRGNVRLTARAGNGASFPLRHSGTGTPGEMRMEMPQGSYVLEAMRQGSDGSEQGQARMTVGTAEVNGVLLRMSPVNQIPVEVAGDSSAASDNKLPTAAQLGLSLEDMNLGTDTDEGLLRVVQRSGQAAAFFNPPPGSYRLHAQSGGAWVVMSATYGEADLLRQNLTVSPGVGASPVRIIVSNQTASVSGTVRLNGQPAPAWVYLLASSPSATPIVIVHAGVDGRYNRAALPPGTYRALAFEHRHSIDFENPRALATFNYALRTVSVSAGDKATLDLDITPYGDYAQ